MTHMFPIICINQFHFLPPLISFQTRQSKGMYKLTFREFEYLEFIRRKNVAFFNKIRDGIMKERIGMFTSPQIDTSPALPPCYPLSDDSEDMFPPIKYNA